MCRDETKVVNNLAGKAHLSYRIVANLDKTAAFFLEVFSTSYRDFYLPNDFQVHLQLCQYKGSTTKIEKNIKYPKDANALTFHYFHC